MTTIKQTTDLYNVGRQRESTGLLYGAHPVWLRGGQQALLAYWDRFECPLLSRTVCPIWPPAPLVGNNVVPYTRCIVRMGDYLVERCHSDGRLRCQLSPRLSRQLDNKYQSQWHYYTDHFKLSKNPKHCAPTMTNTDNNNNIDNNNNMDRMWQRLLKYLIYFDISFIS